MVRDVGRYLPAVLGAEYADSLFEVKPSRQERGRRWPADPVRKHPELPGCYSVLGGKIDNIYDALEKIDAEFSEK